jgi:hypothetical protein
MQPHHLSPHVVFGGRAPWTDNLYPPHSGGQHFHGTSLEHLLAEPPVRSPAWLSAVHARMVVASTGPVLAAEAGTPGVQRLERARWLRIAPDADAARARAAAWPDLETVSRLSLGVGSLAPDLVIVGERDPQDRLPMFARSGQWLFRALRILGWDEMSIYCTNALDRDQRGQGSALTLLRDAFGAYGPQFLALGAIAAEVLTAAGIEHLTCEHPSHARRFEFKDGPEGYAKRLEACGLERRSSPVWTPEGPGIPVLAERLGIPLDPSTKPNPGSRPTHKDRLAPALVDQARMAFVLGQCSTIQQAAEKATESKADRRALVKLARSQGWEVERERFFAEKREKVKASATEQEARRIGESRGLAWEVTQKMLAKLNDSLNDPTVQVYAKEAKAMGELAMQLSEKGDASFDEERKRLAGLTPEAFSEELRKVLESNFGMKSEEPVAPPAPPAA